MNLVIFWNVFFFHLMLDVWPFSHLKSAKRKILSHTKLDSANRNYDQIVQRKVG